MTKVHGHYDMIARFEPGLPGTGPQPFHLHTGVPSPWSEGCIVRVMPSSGKEWIGNLQEGWGYSTKIIEWPEAEALIVIAKGSVYFIRPDQPNEWSFIDLLGIDCVIAPTRDLALISTYNAVIAISNDGTKRWSRSVAVDGVEITNIQNGLVHGKAGIDPPEEWHSFVLELETGNEVAG